MSGRIYTPERASSFARWYAKNRDACLVKQKEWRRSEAGQRAQFDRICRRKGITPEIWQSAWDSTGGRCHGCENPLTQGPTTHIDHCHSTGRFRGLLCSGCNHALGKTKDNPATLRRLADYLERSVS